MPTSGSVSLNSNYVPPKDWEVLTADEKIERMRDILKSHVYSLSYTQNQLSSVRRQLSKHEHVDGKVIEQKEITQYDNDSSLGGPLSASSENKYF